MHILLFGGAFDPPHNGHLHVVSQVLQQQLAEEVWFLPVKNHAFDKQLTSVEHRMEMLSMLSQDLPNTKIEEFELHQPGISITYDTLSALSLKYPQHTFSFLMGSDNIEKFHLWHHYQEMLKEFDVLVYPREGFEDTTPISGMKLLENVPPMRVSSTQIKSRLKQGKGISDLVPTEIHQYILENSLYKN